MEKLAIFYLLKLVYSKICKPNPYKNFWVIVLVIQIIEMDVIIKNNYYNYVWVVMASKLQILYWMCGKSFSSFHPHTYVSDKIFHKIINYILLFVPTSICHFALLNLLFYIFIIIYIFSHSHNLLTFLSHS